MGLSKKSRYSPCPKPLTTLPKKGGGFCPVRHKVYIPVALSKSQGAGSVLALANLSGAHLYIQVLGNKTGRQRRSRHTPFFSERAVRRQKASSFHHGLLRHHWIAQPWARCSRDEM